MNEATVTIRRLGPDDLTLLREISILTFQDTFSSSNTAENMDFYIEQSLSENGLRLEMVKPGTEFYFAYGAKQEVLGYLKLNYGSTQTEAQPESYLEVERIYVLKEYQGLKIGLSLMEFAIQRAGELKRNTIWLGVWEHNTKAIRFYAGLGFVPFDTHVFQLGDDAQTDILMKKELAN